MSLSKKSTLTFLAQSVIFVLSIGVSVILARSLGPTSKGIYTLIVLIHTLMLKFATLGIEEATVYYTGSRKYTREEMVSSSFISGLILGLVFIALFFVLMHIPAFKSFLYANQINPLYLWLAVFTVPVVLTLVFLKSVILGMERVNDFNKIDIFQICFQLIGVVVLLLVFGRGLFGAVLSYILTIIGTALVAISVVAKIAKFNFVFRKQALADSIAYGWKPYIGSVSQFLNYRLNMIIMAFFLPPAAIGYYSISILLAERLWMIPTSIGTVLFPRISSLGEKDANALTPKVARFTFFIIIIISAALGAAAGPLIRFLFGKEFQPAVYPFLILLPGVIIIAVAKILTSDLGGRGRPEIGMLSAVASLAVNVPLNIILIPKWGISGAAFATSFAYIFASLIVMGLFKRISGSRLSDFFLIRRQDFQDYFNSFRLSGFLKAGFLKR